MAQTIKKLSSKFKFKVRLGLKKYKSHVYSICFSNGICIILIVSFDL